MQTINPVLCLQEGQGEEGLSEVPVLQAAGPSLVGQGKTLLWTALPGCCASSPELAQLELVLSCHQILPGKIWDIDQISQNQNVYSNKLKYS